MCLTKLSKKKKTKGKNESAGGFVSWGHEC